MFPTLRGVVACVLNAACSRKFRTSLKQRYRVSALEAAAAGFSLRPALPKKSPRLNLAFSCRQLEANWNPGAGRIWAPPPSEMGWARPEGSLKWRHQLAGARPGHRRQQKERSRRQSPTMAGAAIGSVACWSLIFR